DEDGDGLTNTQELALGTDAYQADTDGDGVSDGAEVRSGTNPLLKPSFPANTFSVSFNGTSTQRVISPRPVQDDFTFSFWIKTSAAGTGSTQWYQGWGLLDGEVGGVTGDFGTSLMTGGKVGFGVGNPDTTLISSKSVNDNSWHHVAVTRVAATGSMMIYIDGVLDRSLTGPTGTKTAPPRLTVGSLQTNINYFSGQMADFRIYDRAASGAEVWQLANRISATGSHALASLTVVNSDFETGGFIDDRYSSSPGVIPAGWQAVPGAAPSGNFYGYYNPINDAGGYTSGVSGTPGVTGTMLGPNVFYFGSATTGQGIQQTLSSTFSLSTDYTLTVARGTRNGTYNNTLRMQLFAGSTLLTSRDVAPEPAGSRGTFLDYSTTYVASVANNSANAGLVGQPLIIRFLEIDNPGGGQRGHPAGGCRCGRVGRCDRPKSEQSGHGWGRAKRRPRNQHLRDRSFAGGHGWRWGPGRCRSYRWNQS
ncbi:LamG domain-containing protein, partial [bacterium]|nr:LamG domain-containing protein [bacterium]